MLLQRFGAIFSNISGLKNADLKAFTMALANNMEAIWAVTLCRGNSIVNDKTVWRAYLMYLHAKTKTLGSIFARITL